MSLATKTAAGSFPGPAFTWPCGFAENEQRASILGLGQDNSTFPSIDVAPGPIEPVNLLLLFDHRRLRMVVRRAARGLGIAGRTAPDRTRAPRQLASYKDGAPDTLFPAR